MTCDMLAEDRPNTSVTDNLQLNLSYVEGEARLENKFMNAVVIILHRLTTLHFHLFLNDLQCCYAKTTMPEKFLIR